MLFSKLFSIYTWILIRFVLFNYRLVFSRVLFRSQHIGVCLSARFYFRCYLNQIFHHIAYGRLSLFPTNWLRGLQWETFASKLNCDQYADLCSVQNAVCSIIKKYFFSILFFFLIRRTKKTMTIVYRLCSNFA